MRYCLLVGSIAVSMGLAIACSDKLSSESDAVDDGADGGGSLLPSSGAPEAPAGTGLGTGLPCDVQAVIENRCIACHSGDNPSRLLTFSDLTAKSLVDPNKTLAELSLERMRSTTSRMPPPPAEPPEVDEIEAFDAWAKAGFARNPESCTDGPMPGDGGAAGANDAGVDAGRGDGGCTSGTFWRGNVRDEDPRMNPGEACLACHQRQGGPNFRAAGTIYPTLHEPDDCNGSAPPPRLTVIITDALGRRREAVANEVGNFMFRGGALLAPLRAQITDGTNTRAMQGRVTSGDCNSCHTAEGRNGAPGRILAP